MEKLKVIVVLFLLASCSSTTISKKDLQYLNGYWEIKKVVFSDGTSKEYKASTAIDFFKVAPHPELQKEQSRPLQKRGESETLPLRQEIYLVKGIRKKVQPKIGGTYISNKDIDSLQIIEKEGIFRLFYKNGINQREERIVSLTKNQFSVTDNQNTTYTYTRYKPIVLD